MATGGGKHISLPKPFALGDSVEWFQRLAVRLGLTMEEQASYATTEEKIVSRIGTSPIGIISGFP